MNRITLLYLLVLGVILSACRERNTLAHVERMLGEKITLNLNQMIRVDSSTNNTYDSSLYTIVCYYDSAECQTCASDKLYLWNNFMKKWEGQQKLDYIFIFCPSSNSHQYLQTFLEGKNEKKNIYIDTLHIFERMNPFLPKPAMYHTMLVDNNDWRVKLVGDPRRNKMTENLFCKIIKDNQTEQ